MNWKAPIRIAAYLLVYLGVPVLASGVSNQTVGTVLAIAYILRSHWDSLHWHRYC